jgi:hypothetical protein
MFWTSHTAFIILHSLMQIVEYLIIGPLISQITLDIEGFQLHLVSVYVPAQLVERKAFFSQALSKLDYQPNIIVVGDFNTYKSNELDQYSPHAGKGWKLSWIG